MDIIIFKDMTTEEKLSEIESQASKFKGLIVDMNNQSERKKVKDSASLINGMLKKLDRERIDRKKEFSQQVESEADFIRERLESANSPLTALIDEHKQKERIKREAENLRQNEISTSFDRMNDVALEAIGQTSTAIESIIDELSCYDFDPATFQERTDQAVKKHSKLMQQLDTMLKQAKAQEEMEARAVEIERKERHQSEREEAERLRIDREKIAHEAAEKAIVEAVERHKIEMQEAEQRRVRDAETAVQAERERIKAEEIAKQEEVRKREKDRKHRGKIHSEIARNLTGHGLSEADAKNVVELIAKGKAGNVRVFY